VIQSGPPQPILLASEKKQGIWVTGEIKKEEFETKRRDLI